MSILVVILGLFIAAVGVIGMVCPAHLISLARSWQTRTGLYLAALLRIGLGLLLFLVAGDSRAPHLLRVLGVVIFVSGVVTPVLGPERFHTILEWWDARGVGFKRVWCGCAFAFGLLLVYAVVF